MRTQIYAPVLSAVFLTGFYTTTGLLLGLGDVARAQTIFRDDFTNGLTWTTSDSGSVYIKDAEYLYIGANGVNNNSAEKIIHVDLSTGSPIVIEQRLKLESGGMNYRLPDETISFEDSSKITITYLPNFPDRESQPPYGWGFGGWTGNHDHAVPGAGYWDTATADYWAVTRIVLTPTGGELFVKPDDAANGWFDTQFYSVASTNWSHSSVETINFSQPWDSVCYVDSISISQIPEPSTFSLLALGGLLLLRRRKK